MVEPSGNTVSMSVWSEPLILCGPHLAGFSTAVPGTGVCFCSFPHFGVLDSSTWQSPLTLISLCEMLHPLLWKLWEPLTAGEDQGYPGVVWEYLLGYHRSSQPCWGDKLQQMLHHLCGWNKNVILAFSLKWPWSLVCGFLNQYRSDLLGNLVGASMCSLWRNIARSCSC